MVTPIPSAPLEVTGALFVARHRLQAARQAVWWGTVLALLVSLGWLAFAALRASALGEGLSLAFPSLAAPLGLSGLVAAFAAYRWNACPWQPERLVDPRAEDPLRAFRPGAWLALRQARELADALRRPLGPAHLALGCFVTREGASVLARLGITFDAVQEPFLPLVRAGESVAAGQATAPSLTDVVAEARALALASDDPEGIGPNELLRATLRQDPGVAQALEAAGADANEVDGIGRWLAVQAALKADHDRFARLAAAKPDSDLNRTMTARQTELLNQVSEDLTRLAKSGYVAPVIEREEAWASCVRTWEAGERVVVLVGPEGAGKTAFVEGVARRMVEEDVPKALFDKRLVSVHVPELVTGDDAGMISQRLLQLVRETALSGNVVLVLEGIEALAGAGYGGTRDLFELLSAEIERLGLFVVATTTAEAWTQYLEGRSFGRRAAKVLLDPPPFEVAEAVLFAHASGLEYKHQVFFTYAALRVALDAADQPASGLAKPGNAVGWLREAAASVRAERGERALVGRDDVAKIVEEKTGIPARVVQDDEAARLLRLEDALKARVIGQDEAVAAVAQAMRRARADVRDARRPMASFLFLGPTGVGKTELAKALASEYFGAEDRMVRLDLSEYQALSSLPRLIGFPQDPKGGLLTEAIRQKPYALILLDEMEKAHPDILTLFLQVLDDGRLTDGTGRTIDFSHTIIIATSNAAAPFIQKRIGEGATAEQLRRELLERELKTVFRPEFLNRFDGVQVFRPLERDDVTRIAWILLHGLEKRLLEKGIKFRAEDAAVEALAHDGFDREFGARPLRRLLQDRVETAIADLVLRKAVKRGDTLVLGERGQVEVRPE